MLVLEDELSRQLEIPIGLCEARAIKIMLTEEQVPRPITHDLLKTITDQLAAPVNRVVIDDLSHNTYYARLMLNGPDGEISLDCRPSDGIALALRAHATIWATEDVIRGESHGR